MTSDLIRYAVRNGRLDLTMTQDDLAHRAGVSRQWIAGLESGRMANPRLSSITAVLDALGLTLAVQPRSLTLVGSDSENEPSPNTSANATSRPQPNGSAALQFVLEQNRMPAPSGAALLAVLQGNPALTASAITTALNAIKGNPTLDNSAITTALNAIKGNPTLDAGQKDEQPDRGEIAPPAAKAFRQARSRPAQTLESSPESAAAKTAGDVSPGSQNS